MQPYSLPPDLRYGGLATSAAASWSLPPAIWDGIRSRVTGKGSRVAVLDTGYNPQHRALPKPIAERSFVRGLSTTDGHGHGSHCGGTAVGRDPRYGVAIEADYIVARVLDNQGNGYDDAIIAAGDWAVSEGATVLSLSLGGAPGGPENPAMTAMLRRAAEAGCIPVVAAGNSGYNGRRNTIGEPAKREEVLCIGAISENGNIADFSSGGREMDFAAPGQNIPSCSHRGSEIVIMSGTSMATPFVAGLIALLQELIRREGRPWLQGAAAYRELFQHNVDDRGAVGPDPVFGLGVPRAADLVAALISDDIQWV